MEPLFSSNRASSEGRKKTYANEQLDAYGIIHYYSMHAVSLSETVWEGRLGQEGAMSGHSKWRKKE